MLESLRTSHQTLLLIAALVCIPFGLMLLTPGVAKWIRNRGLARNRG